MVRKLTAALLGVGVFVPGLANALGLGEIKLNSHLSEPLDAEIELVQVRELTESEILPGLASPSEFTAAGVERFHHLTDMKFQVVVNSSGRSYVKVKSRKPIREPFVNFLVEVHWPAGRLLREYTLLLDPPNFSPAAPQPVQPSVTTTAAPQKVTLKAEPTPAPKPTPKATQPAVSAPVAAPAPTPAAGSDGKTYGPTKGSDSLWTIARELRPSRSVSIQQTMIAIQRLNPDAFIHGNINLLKKGKILRGPSVAEAKELTTRQAISQVTQQNRAWKERVAGGRTAAEAETAQIDTSGRAVDSFEETVSSDEGRLRLVSADAEAGAATTGQGGTGSTDSGQLRARAELAEEKADQAQLENQDLKQKVTELEEQVGTSQKLLELKDDQITALQARLAKIEEALEKVAQGQSLSEPAEVEPVSEEAPLDASVDYNFAEDGAKQPKESSVAVEQPQEPSAPTEEAGATEEAEAIKVEESPKEVVIDAPEEKPVEPKPEQTLMEQVLSNPLYLAVLGGGVLVLAVLGFVASRRRNEDEGEYEDALAEDFSLNVEEESADLEAEEDLQEDDIEETIPQTSDVLGEADIYIAYGRFPQAIEMLEKAVDVEPHRGDIRLKLLETAVEAKDQETFKRHYDALKGMDIPNDIARANALKDKFIGDDSFAEDFGEPTGEGDTALDMDFSFDEEDTQIQPSSDRSFDAAEESNELDFNLDLDVTEMAEEPAAETEVPTSEDGLEEQDQSLDFNLDLDEDSVAGEEAVEANSEFSLDFEETEEASNEEAVSFGEAEDSLDFELAEEPEAETAEADGEDSLAFNLDLDDLDAEDGSEVLDAAGDDDTIIAVPEELGETVKSADVIGSDEAAQLAEELDLEGDFSLDTEDLEASPEVVEEDDDFSFVAEVDDIESPVESVEVVEEEALLDVEPETQFEAEPDIMPEAEPEVAVAPASVSAEAANSEEELDFLSDADEASTKLDLARAYIDMGDREGAKDILDEVLVEGNNDQQGEAKELLAKLD